MSYGNPLGKMILVNQFGEQSEMSVIEEGTTYQRSGYEYGDEGSFQVVAPDLELAADAGSDDASDPSFLAPIMGNVIGDDMENEANYLGGVIGAYSVTGTKATTYPTGAVLGIIMDEVTDVDGAFTANIDGDSGVTTANAAFKAMMTNSNAGSGFNYGVDLYHPAVGDYLELGILKADLRLSKEICIMSHSTTPVNGTEGTGAGFAAKGSLCVARDTGLLYQNTNTKASPTWTVLESGSSELGQVLTGFSSGAGTLSAADTILQGFNKLAGNTQNTTVIGNVITGFVSGAGVVADTDTILQAINKLDGNQIASAAVAADALPSASFTDAAVSGKVLTGLAAGANTPITATDTILVALANLQAQIDAL